MPAFTIDEEAMRKKSTFDVSAPQYISSGQPMPGIPVKQIPHAEFPRVVYKHPNEPFRRVIHRNAQQEIVHEEMIPAEHLAKTVNDEQELAAALKDGWQKKPYVPAPPEDPDAHLYEPKKAGR